MRQIHLYLSEKELKSLKAMAVKTGLAYSEHIRRAIDGYLVRLSRKDVMREK